MKTEIDEAISDLEKLISQTPPEKVAYVIMKMFLNTKEPSEELRDTFVTWLLSPRNAQAKEVALERCFCEALESDSTATGKAIGLK